LQPIGGLLDSHDVNAIGRRCDLHSEQTEAAPHFEHARASRHVQKANERRVRHAIECR
jgi:hypothetical protein